MHKQFKTLIILFFILAILPMNVCAAETLDINYIIEHAKELDGQEVTVEGEAIGEQMERGDFSWVNINDGTNAMGIWLKNCDAEKVETYGNYKYKGDIIKITGIFHRACDEHGGESDIHNISLDIIEDGYIVNENISNSKIIIAAVLTAFTLLLLLFFYKTIRMKL